MSYLGVHRESISGQCDAAFMNVSQHTQFIFASYIKMSYKRRRKPTKTS